MYCNVNKPNSGIVFQLKCIALNSRPTYLPLVKCLLYMKIDFMIIWAINLLTKLRLNIAKHGYLNFGIISQMMFTLMVVMTALPLLMRLSQKSIIFNHTSGEQMVTDRQEG
jgi:hypothetical protein